MAAPGKFKHERKWQLWESALELMLATIPIAMGVPLNYVIHEQVLQPFAMSFCHHIQQRRLSC